MSKVSDIAHRFGDCMCKCAGRVTDTLLGELNAKHSSPGGIRVRRGAISSSNHPSQVIQCNG